MTIWDGRGELGFEFRFWTLNLWTNPSWTKLKLKWPTQCCSAQTPGEIVWFFLQKHLHWKTPMALTQFLPFLFEKTEGIWKTARLALLAPKFHKSFYQLQATGRNVLLPLWTSLAGISASPASPGSLGHNAPTRLRLNVLHRLTNEQQLWRENQLGSMMSANVTACTDSLANRSRDFEASWNA